VSARVGTARRSAQYRPVDHRVGRLGNGVWGKGRTDRAACVEREKGIGLCPRTHDDPEVGASQRRGLAANYLVFGLGCRRACAKSDAATLLTRAGVAGLLNSFEAMVAVFGEVCFWFLGISIFLASRPSVNLKCARSGLHRHAPARAEDLESSVSTFHHGRLARVLADGR
jgi:hypothetical protein